VFRHGRELERDLGHSAQSALTPDEQGEQVWPGALLSGPTQADHPGVGHDELEPHYVLRGDAVLEGMGPA